MNEKNSNLDDRMRQSVRNADHKQLTLCLAELKTLFWFSRRRSLNSLVDGKTLLVDAIEKENIDCVRSLLEAGANPDITMKDNHTALTIVAKHHSGTVFGLECIIKLLNAKAAQDNQAQI